MHGDSLNKYCRASHELREALQNDFYLDAIDRMTLENLMVVMEMTYKMYTRRNPDDWGHTASELDHLLTPDRFSSLFD